MKSILAIVLLVANLSLDDIILDIYRSVTETSETDYEQLQTDLYALHDHPIDLNSATEEELSQLVFLSPQQIDAILAYADKHPFQSLYELRMIPCLADYEIRDLLPFVTVSAPAPNNNMYAREVFRHADHEAVTRVDARTVEAFEGTDPIYIQTRYRFDYQRRVTFGAQLRRPAGSKADALQYGGYIQIRDIGHVHSLVAGNYQAGFGQGLVLAPVYHSGKSGYVLSVGQQQQGLRYYSSVDGEGLHGAGTTLRWAWNKTTRLDASVLYSMQRANDSTWHHIVGTNLTFRHKRLEIQLTAIENLWSDSIRPYNNARYNHHYFRGRHQAVAGGSLRYNHGWFDVFAEAAAAENYDRFGNNQAHWGVGTIAGSRFYPTDGVALMALYRYYSPFFDNALGYAFSESARIGDENGGYIGWDITRLKNWRFTGYGDVFRFSGIKYGIPYSPSIGYDAVVEADYRTDSRSGIYAIRCRLRAREKGGTSTYFTRLTFDWQREGWSLRTTVDANLTSEKEERSMGYGVSVAQDIGYSFRRAPVSVRGRVQFFDAQAWANRIYLYEHDVLYAFSIPATYGLGGRAYVCLRWQINAHFALYGKISETVYQHTWAEEHQRTDTRTDVHVTLRATW